MPELPRISAGRGRAGRSFPELVLPEVGRSGAGRAGRTDSRRRRARCAGCAAPAPAARPFEPEAGRHYLRKNGGRMPQIPRISAGRGRTGRSFPELVLPPQRGTHSTPPQPQPTPTKPPGSAVRSTGESRARAPRAPAGAGASRRATSARAADLQHQIRAGRSAGAPR